MYKLSKIGVIILYPLVSLVPVLGLVMSDTQLATDNTLSGNSIASLINISTLASLILIVLAIIYSYQAYKKHLFKRQPDGTRLAGVSDWFAVIFSALILAGLLNNLLKLFV